VEEASQCDNQGLSAGIESMLIPVSVIIPTYNRRKPLEATLKSLAGQEVQFNEIVIVDASPGAETELLCSQGIDGIKGTMVYKRAVTKGAAAQRNEGYNYAGNSVLAFMDDDIVFEPDCIGTLWNCFNHREDIGGVSALITNEQYAQPGRMTLLMCRLLNGERLPSYAGKCIGPAWQFLPGGGEGTSAYNQVDWLNLGCTIYRKEALPDPPFQRGFTGYSLMEDLALSLTVGKKWKLFNARDARIFHDSQPGDYKSNVTELAKMELVNRYWIMTQILGRRGITNLLRLSTMQIFVMFGTLRNSQGRKNIFKMLKGKMLAVFFLIKKSQTGTKQVLA
jgi:glycosyltransferase involved in cell wall biosynthesis